MGCLLTTAGLSLNSRHIAPSGPSAVLVLKQMAPGRKYCCTSGRCRGFLRDNLLVLLTVLGALMGSGVGLGVRALQPSAEVVLWIGLPGEVYMRMLKMMILPLIICCVLTGTASLDPRCHGKVSAVALTYIVITNFLPCVVGIAMVFAIQPGKAVTLLPHPDDTTSKHLMETSDIFADLIRNLFPDNLVTACFQKAQTQYRQAAANSSGQLVNNTGAVTIRTLGAAPATNVLGLVVCCMVLGMAVSAVGRDASPFLAFFRSASDVIMKVLGWVVWMTPVGVASLVAQPLLQTAQLIPAVQSLGLFSLTVVTSLGVYGLFVLPLCVFLLTRQNPYAVMTVMGRPLMVALATCSSCVLILDLLGRWPSQTRCAHWRSGVTWTGESRASSSLWRLPSTGTAPRSSSPSPPSSSLSCLLSTWMLPPSSSSLPSASVVTVLIILTSVGIPSGPLGLLLATEWFLDRLRACCNLLSSAYCAHCTMFLCKASLPPLPLTDVTTATRDVTIDIEDPCCTPCRDKANNSHVTDTLLPGGDCSET
ncbi:excitatory amino acid transporter-like isoform X2 [Babylonia areolata]|uniref:excitatory amino acid transporter-like isoform X2 n=1 Tax=Babylonia areolata TaxID=304850 RepID=UPI003FD44064